MIPRYLSHTFLSFVKATWSRGFPGYFWALGFQYALDPLRRHIFKAKVDDHQRIYVSLRSQILMGVKTTVSAMFDDVDDTHVGFGIEIER